MGTGGQKEREIERQRKRGDIGICSEILFWRDKTEAGMINRINMMGRGEPAPKLLHPFPIPQWLCFVGGGHPSAQAPDNENGFEPRLPIDTVQGERRGAASYGRARPLAHSLAFSPSPPPFPPDDFSLLLASDAFHFLSYSIPWFQCCSRLWGGGQWKGAGDIPTLSSLSLCVCVSRFRSSQHALPKL